MKSLFSRMIGQSEPVAETPPAPVAGWAPTHRHRKGGLYRLLGHGVDEATRGPVAIYDDAEGTTWVRSLVEFEDGRFTPLS